MPGVSRRVVSCLVVLYGAELGKRFPLGRSTFEIGRSSKSDLPLESDAVSRNHARISWSKTQHVIADMGSTNGTWVNDERVPEAELADGDQIKIGRTLLKYMSGEDIEANYNEEVYRIMTVDALTRTYNERYFLEALERECNRSRRHERELSILLFRVDRFRELARVHGVVAGDALLRLVATAVQPRLRKEDVMARLRDERFAILLPEVGKEGGRAAADKVRQLVMRTSFIVEEVPLPCTLSIGLATLEKGHVGSGDLILAARAALRRAREAGGDRVE